MVRIEYIFFFSVFLPRGTDTIGLFFFQDFGIGGSENSSSLEESPHRLLGMFAVVTISQ